MIAFFLVPEVTGFWPLLCWDPLCNMMPVSSLQLDIWHHEAAGFQRNMVDFMLCNLLTLQLFLIGTQPLDNCTSHTGSLQQENMLQKEGDPRWFLKHEAHQTVLLLDLYLGQGLQFRTKSCTRSCWGPRCTLLRMCMLVSAELLACCLCSSVSSVSSARQLTH